jgi:hypothetical protein
VGGGGGHFSCGPPHQKIRGKYFISLIKRFLPFILLNSEVPKKITDAGAQKCWKKPRQKGGRGEMEAFFLI